MDVRAHAELSALTKDNVRKALQAQQDRDLNTWYGCFTDNVTFIRDGKEENFKAYSESSFDFSEHMLKIEKVEENGLYVFGIYFAGKYGIFRIYYRFHENVNGKFDKLEMEQIGLTINYKWEQAPF